MLRVRLSSAFFYLLFYLIIKIENKEKE